MSVSRQAGLGQAFFRSKFLTDNTKGIYDFTCRFNENPALVPAMEWSETTAPSAPSYLRIKRGATADELEWFGAKDPSDTPYLLYHLYATTDEEVDITNAQQLVATRLMDNRIRVPHPENIELNYAVTAANRYGCQLCHHRDIARYHPVHRLLGARTQYRHPHPTRRHLFAQVNGKEGGYSPTGLLCHP